MGTTSEELKKLYAKLGGKDPKVAGFSAPGEILNAINEIPLPTEYELPTVTTEDAGDVLVVNEEGKWDKGEAGSGLPEVTTDDNGDILQVIEGAWAKAAMSKDVVVYEAEFATIGSTYYLANLINAVQKDIIDSIISGKTVLIKFYNAKTFNARQTIYYYLHTYIERNKQAYFIGDCFSTDNKSNKEYYYIKLEYTDSGTISLNLAQKQVPTPGDIYNGKILQVVNGQYVFVDPPASLPEVTTADNGDILQVVNGAWSKAAPSGGGDCAVYTAQFSSGQAILDNGTISEIAGITSSKAVFIICRSGSVQGQNGLYYYSGRGRVGAPITENTLHFSKVFRYYNGTSNEIVFSELTAYVPDGGSKFNYESSTLATT